MQILRGAEDSFRQLITGSAQDTMWQSLIESGVDHLSNILKWCTTVDRCATMLSLEGGNFKGGHCAI
jgi:hypothetical protein